MRSERMRRAWFMLGLMIAGEAVFALPFHVTRFFRPSVLELFGLSNTQLGAVQGAYGVVAMLAYFLGGPLADRFPVRNLLVASLWTTAAGGMYMATFPAYRGALLLWGFFGLTTILLFWAALIRATRDWGEAHTQGRAYGLLEGGRGVLAAGMASAAVLLFGVFFPEGYGSADPQERREALRMVIYGYTLVTAGAGVLVWWVVPVDRAAGPREDLSSAWLRVRQVLRMPAVWLQGLVVTCAYAGYKGFDNYALYAVQVHGMDEVEAAHLVAVCAWMRPVAALAAGLLGDRYTISSAITVAFALLMGTNLLFAALTPAPGLAWMLWANMLLAAAAIFGLRGLYFALFHEARVPLAVTGTAVGLVSLVGFTPDVYFLYVGGLLLDSAPGVEGHRHFFLLLAAFAAVGLCAARALVRLRCKRGS